MPDNNSQDKKITRRDILKGLSTTPILGFFAYDFWKKKALTKMKERAIISELGLSEKSISVLPKSTMKKLYQVLTVIAKQQQKHRLNR